MSDQTKKHRTPPPFDPVAALALSKHTFGEHGGVNMSIEASTTFTVMKAATMPEIFAGRRDADHDGCFLYARHFNPTVFTLGHELAALEDRWRQLLSAVRAVGVGA